MTNAGSPCSLTSASTSTRRDSRPTSACVMARASTVRRYGRKCVGLRAPCDQNVLEVLARAAAGPTIDVTAQAMLQREPRALEDLGIELAAVVDDDQHRRAVDAGGRGVGERSRDALGVRGERRARCPRSGGAELELTAVVERQQLVGVAVLLVVVDQARVRRRGDHAVAD